LAGTRLGYATRVHEVGVGPACRHDRTKQRVCFATLNTRLSAIDTCKAATLNRKDTSAVIVPYLRPAVMLEPIHCFDSSWRAVTSISARNTQLRTNPGWIESLICVLCVHQFSSCESSLLLVALLLLSTTHDRCEQKVCAHRHACSKEVFASTAAAHRCKHHAGLDWPLSNSPRVHLQTVCRNHACCDQRAKRA
jgi:hypothetical protein